MGKVETAMRRIVLMLLGLTVTAHVVAIEIATVTYLAVSSYREAAACHMLHYGIACHHLCISADSKSYYQ